MPTIGATLPVNVSPRGRPSTNGTWFRLSALHEPSPAYPLRHQDELLVGNIRFQVNLTETVVERELD